MNRNFSQVLVSCLMEWGNEAVGQRYSNRAGGYGKRTQAPYPGGTFNPAASRSILLFPSHLVKALSISAAGQLVPGLFATVFSLTCKKSILVSKHSVFLLSILVFCKTFFCLFVSASSRIPPPSTPYPFCPVLL